MILIAEEQPTGYLLGLSCGWDVEELKGKDLTNESCYKVFEG